MPIKTTCPECDKAYTLADTMQGKSVKCKDCGQPFTVQAAANGIAAKPSNGKVGKATVKRVVRDDDDDEVAVKKKKGGIGMFLLIGGGLVAVLMLFVCGGAGIAALVWWNSGSDTDTASNTSTTDKDKDKDKDKQTAPLNGVPASKVTKENFDKIKGGMTAAEVKNILGTGNISDHVTDGPGMCSWSSGTNAIIVMYDNGKVKTWSAGIDRQHYGPYQWTDPTIKLTLENFKKIQGGMNSADVLGILGPPNTEGAIPPDAAYLNLDKATAQYWTTGMDAITVIYCDGKAARWTGVIGGRKVGPFMDAKYLVTKTPNQTSAVTLDNYNKIMGGESEQQIKDLLKGAKLNANTGATDQDTAKYDKTLIDMWSDSHGNITVTFCNGKAAHWTGIIDGKQMDAKTNQQFVILKGNDPNPAPGSKLTKALYDQIMENKTTLGALIQAIGAQPKPTGNNGTQKNPANFRAYFAWVDGNARIEVHVDAQGIIRSKKEQNLK